MPTFSITSRASLRKLLETHHWLFDKSEIRFALSTPTGRMKSCPPFIYSFTTHSFPRFLHLVAAHVVVVQAFKPLSQLFAADLLTHGRGLLRCTQYLVLNIDRTIHPQRNRQRIRR